MKTTWLLLHIAILSSLAFLSGPACLSTDSQEDIASALYYEMGTSGSEYCLVQEIHHAGNGYSPSGTSYSIACEGFAVIETSVFIGGAQKREKQLANISNALIDIGYRQVGEFFTLGMSFLGADIAPGALLFRLGEFQDADPKSYLIFEFYGSSAQVCLDGEQCVQFAQTKHIEPLVADYLEELGYLGELAELGNIRFKSEESAQ